MQLKALNNKGHKRARDEWDRDGIKKARILPQILLPKGSDNFEATELTLNSFFQKVPIMQIGARGPMGTYIWLHNNWNACEALSTL
eukprot:scaffold165868_cov16-Prasinocladus_malaysianus.AAC.1